MPERFNQIMGIGRASTGRIELRGYCGNGGFGVGTDLAQRREQPELIVPPCRV